MNPQEASHASLSTTPLGAGDLVDRSVRFYRNNLTAFIYIAAPPVVFGSVTSLIWRVLILTLFGSSIRQDAYSAVVYCRVIWFGNIFIWAVELMTLLIVMGGASVNFVRNLIYGEKLSFVSTYRHSLSRLPRLLVASVLMTGIYAVAAVTILYLGLLGGVLLAAFLAAALSAVPSLSLIVGIVVAVSVVTITGLLFFFVMSKFIYIPQAMMVEGLSLTSSFARSFRLSKGTTRRVAAVFLFTVLASYAALAILYVPLGWYIWINGYEWFSFEELTRPLWYEMSVQLIGQTSILISIPVLIIGLCLMYIDERVRSEGFDIQLLAAQRLPELPELATDPTSSTGILLSQRNMT